MSLNIKKSFDKATNKWCVGLNGEVDIYTASSLKESFIKMLEEHKESVEIDADKLEYIDSTGLGVLIGILKRLKKEEKDVTIRNAKPNIRKLFKITGLDKIFIIEE